MKKSLIFLERFASRTALPTRTLRFQNASLPDDLGNLMGVLR